MTSKYVAWGALVSLVILMVAGLQVWPASRSALYRVVREQGRNQALGQLDGYDRRDSARFQLYYQEQDRNVADLVENTADEVYGEVVRQVGYEPPGPVPLILYPDRTSLRSAFGWGEERSAVGVYWRGTIRLLSPTVWVDHSSAASLAAGYRQVSPIAHELTHYALDYRTNGNYPHWFSEGLAQRVEYRATGFLWIEDESSLRQTLYTMAELNQHFDDLSNQPLAYRESYLLVDYMAAHWGEECLGQIVDRLADGIDFDRAVSEVCGKPMAQIYGDWANWAQAHLDLLDEAG